MEEMDEMVEATLHLPEISIPAPEIPELGDKVIFVVMGTIGTKLGGDLCIVSPTRVLFDAGEFFERPPELTSEDKERLELGDNEDQP